MYSLCLYHVQVTVHPALKLYFEFIKVVIYQMDMMYS